MSIDVDGRWHERRLPLFGTIRKSYASYFAYFPDMLRATMPWLIIGPMAVGCGFWLQVSWMLEAIAETQRGGKPGMPAMPLATTLLPHLGYLVLNIGIVSILSLAYQHFFEQV